MCNRDHVVFKAKSIYYGATWFANPLPISDGSQTWSCIKMT